MTTAPIAFLDGRLVPLAEARISPLDRGFLFGDAVYETVKVVRGRALFLDRHLARLETSLGVLEIARPAGIADVVPRLVEANALASGAVYLQVTRGVAADRRHLPPPELAPTVFAMATAIEFPAEPWALPGFAAVSRRDLRWRHAEVKSTALAATVVGKLDAARAGADEVVWVDRDGAVREAGHANLLVRDARGWHTHPTGAEILAGITRALLIEAAGAAGAAIEERPPRLERREEWLEACVTGTLTGVRGLVRLDGAAVGDGAVGDGTRALARLLAELERREAEP